MKYFILSLLVLCAISCNTDDNEVDCSTVLCVGRPELRLDILDETNQDQYFINIPDSGPEGLTLVSTINGIQGELGFGVGYFISNGRIEIFQLPNSIQIVLENEFDVIISADVETIVNEDECCPSYEISNLVANNGNFEVLDEEGFVFRLTI